MSDQNPISLDQQLIARVHQFLQSTNVSQRDLCRALSCDPGNLSRFLSGSGGLSVRKMHRLLQILNFNRLELAEKFSSKVPSSHILALQENGQNVSLDNCGSWVPGDPNCTDPNDSTDITGTSTARDLDGSDDYLNELHDFLRDQQGIHKAAIEEIQKYLDNATKARVNKGGSTEPVRSVSDNADSRRPGIRSPKFP